MNKIRVPVYHGSIDHLKQLFAKYPRSSPSIEEIKEACLLDGRPEEEVRRMKKPIMKDVGFNGRKIQVLPKPEKSTKIENDQYDAIIEEPENEPIEDFEGFDIDEFESDKEEEC